MDLMSSLLKSNGVSVLRAVTYCWAGRKRRSSSVGIPRDHLGEMQALIEILIQLNDYTITDMILTMNELLRDQSTSNEKVSVTLKTLSSPHSMLSAKRESHGGLLSISLGLLRTAAEVLHGLLVKSRSDVQRMSRTVHLVHGDVSHDQVRRRGGREDPFALTMFVESGVFTSNKRSPSSKNAI